MASGPSQELRISTVELDGDVLVAVGGEVDLETAPHLAGELVGLAAEQLTLDLTGLTFIDSSGVSTLAAAARRFRTTGGRVVIPNPPPYVRRILEITGVDDLFEMTGGGSQPGD